jgi:hypothetical protein
MPNIGSSPCQFLVDSNQYGARAGFVAKAWFPPCHPFTRAGGSAQTPESAGLPPLLPHFVDEKV